MTNKAANFDGTPKSLSRPGLDPALFNIGTGTKTMVLRFKLNTLSVYQALVNAGSVGGWDIFVDPGGQAYFFDNTTNTYVPLFGGVFSTGVDYFLACVMNGHLGTAAVTIINGTSISGITGSGFALSNPDVPFSLGANYYLTLPPLYGPLNGNISDAAWFNRGLTPAEIGVLANQTTGALLNDAAIKLAPDAYWPCNGDALDWSDGLGGGAYPLTNNNGVTFVAATVSVFGVPSAGGGGNQGYNQGFGTGFD